MIKDVFPRPSTCHLGVCRQRPQGRKSRNNLTQRDPAARDAFQAVAVDIREVLTVLDAAVREIVAAPCAGAAAEAVDQLAFRVPTAALSNRAVDQRALQDQDDADADVERERWATVRGT